MYYITKINDNRFACEVVIQDGTERWVEPNKKQAIYSVIKAARVMNHAYINEKDILYKDENQNFQNDEEYVVSKEDYELLEKIKTKNLYVLPHDDLRVIYNITNEECKLIIKIREGDLEVK